MLIQLPIEILWAIIGYILITTFGFIWWAATTTEQLKTLKDLVKAITDNNMLYARKEDIAREMGVIEKQIETLWVKHDRLKEKVDGGTK
jgi:hypothetical protein